MYRIRVIRPEGDDEVYETTKHPSLESLQETVGGWIELITVETSNGARDLIINEEGRLKDFPLNPKASEYAGWPIFGTAVLFEKGKLK